MKAHDERNLTLSSFFLEVPLFGRKKLANFLLQRGPLGPEKKKSEFNFWVSFEKRTYLLAVLLTIGLYNVLIYEQLMEGDGRLR